MIKVDLTEDNFEYFAIRHYDDPNCQGLHEFKEDMQRFKYLNRLLNKYEECGEMRTNLVLNHLVVLYNLFNDAATNLLFYRVAEKHWPILVPFLIYINRLPSDIHLSATRSIHDSDIQIDMNVVTILREFNRQGC
jgi:hypothetical protein